MDYVCLDTDFLIDFLRNTTYAVDFIEDRRNNTVFATTFVNLFELYRGIFQSHNLVKNTKSIDKVTNQFTILNLSQSSVKLAAQNYNKLKKTGNIIDLRELFIGTIALTNNFSIKTNNVKDFSRIDGLKLA